MSGFSSISYSSNNYRHDGRDHSSAVSDATATQREQ